MTKKAIVFTTAKKATKHLGYFCKIICCQEVPKIGQSGHTERTERKPMRNTFQVETVSFTVGHLILLNLCMPHFCYSYFDKSWSTLAEGDEQSYQPKEV